MLTPTDFGIDPDLVPLNHASFGVTHRELARHAEQLRTEIEQDTALTLSSCLTAQLREQAVAVARHLQLPPGEAVMCANTTEAANALAASWPLQTGDQVAMLAGEYSSVIAAWQHFAAQRGASVNILDLPLPATSTEIIERFSDLPAATRVIVVSAITSSTALRLPLQAISQIAQRRGIALLVDAAHVVGHVDDALAGVQPSAVFASLHKWLPIPRPAGLLWVARGAPTIRPAMVSLGWESEDFATRFSWRGTWDPIPQLLAKAGLQLHATWRRDGAVQRACQLADEIAAELTALGLTATGAADLLPQQLRSFLLPTSTAPALYQALAAAGVRVWGRVEAGDGLLRFATHPYSTPAHGEALISLVRRFL